MTAAYQRYPVYKESGIAWLGDVPEHWEVKRLRFTLQINPKLPSNNGLSSDTPVSFIPMEAIQEWGGLDLSHIKPMDEIGSGYTYFAENDVIVAKITPCFENGKGAIAKGLSNKIAFGTTELHVLRNDTNLSAEYLFYITITDIFRKIGASVMYGAGGQKRVPENFIKDFRMGLPPLPEQHAITSFLDTKTAQIDALIAKKERLLERLAEKRMALITHAVTKGLNPAAPMKASGVEWLGEIPGHWELKKIQYIARLNSGESITSTEILDEGEFPVYGGNGVRGYYDKYTHNGEYVLIGRQGALCGNINYAKGKFWASEHAVVVHPTENYVTRWFGELLRSMNLNQYSVSAAQPGISVANIARLHIPVPPLSEQQVIAAYIDTKISEISALKLKIETVIERLKEYRAALITNAVTGKIKVT